MLCLTRSRVVPAIGVTMATSSPAKRLSKELLPTLGAPTNTSCTPSRNIRPWRAAPNSALTRCLISSNCVRARAFSKNSISSSGKSSVDSTKMRSWVRAPTSALMSFEKSPCKERAAPTTAACDWASIRSAMASAWAKSILPFRNARNENSPGSAMASPISFPNSRQRATTKFKSWGPPWHCSSSTSSPVKECGPGK